MYIEWLLVPLPPWSTLPMLNPSSLASSSTFAATLWFAVWAQKMILSTGILCSRALLSTSFVAPRYTRRLIFLLFCSSGKRSNNSNIISLAL